MSTRKSRTIRSTGPVKGTGNTKGKNVKPAWSRMLKPPVSDVSPTKSNMFVSEDDDDESEDEIIAKHAGKNFKSTDSIHSAPPQTHQRKNGKTLRGQQTANGFNLRKSLSALEINGTRASQDYDDVLNSTTFNRQSLSPTNRNGLVSSASNRTTTRQTFGPREPNISNEFEKLVLSGSFINFGDIVIMLGHSVSREEANELVKRDILIWLDCYMLYVDIIGSVAPGRITSLTRYARVIMWIYKESKEVTAWWRYDVAYRRLVSLKGVLHSTFFFHV